jgi:hypothetical protein
VESWLCFGVGLNNFATRRMRTAGLTERLADDPEVSVVRSFGATGNVLVKGNVSAAKIADQLGALTPGGGWAVVCLGRIARYVEEVRSVPSPEPGVGIRWTKGIALPVERPDRSTLTSTTRAELRWTSDGRAVAVLKRDLLNDQGRLDSARRLGG